MNPHAITFITSETERLPLQQNYSQQPLRTHTTMWARVHMYVYAPSHTYSHTCMHVHTHFNFNFFHFFFFFTLFNCHLLFLLWYYYQCKILPLGYHFTLLFFFLISFFFFSPSLPMLGYIWDCYFARIIYAFKRYRKT